MTKIVTRLIVLGILITLCVAVMIFSVILINERSLKDGYIINIAGKERTLTQKITKEIFIINSQNSKDYMALNQAIAEFEQNLKVLRFGDPKHGISPPNKKILITKLDSISQKWKNFKIDVESFKQTSSKLYKDREFLYANNLTMLKLSDKIVKAMVNANLSATQIDDSGRQRMLTQRMTYLLVRYINNWEEYVYHDLKENYVLYDDIIKKFAQNPSYKKIPNLSQSIQEAYSFWQEYSKHISTVLKMQGIVITNLRNIVQSNNEILNEIDWLVDLYSDISVHSRTYLEKFQYAAAFIMVLLALYSIYHLLKIHGILKRFVDKTQLLVNGKLTTNLSQVIQLEGDSELSKASQNLSRFIQQIERTKETSNQAIYLSESINEEIANISDEIRNKLAHAKISDSKRKSIENAISLGEDIAIQSSEQLIATAKLIEKLHIILKEIEDSYKSKN